MSILWSLTDLCVAPAWERERSQMAGKKPADVLWLDPGLVFGNGLHPTTRHLPGTPAPAHGRGDRWARCWIWAAAPAFWAWPPPSRGPGRCSCVDLNPLCVHTTRNNAELKRSCAWRWPRVRPLNSSTGRPNWSWPICIGRPWRSFSQTPGPWAGKEDLILSGITRSHAGAA